MNRALGHRVLVCVTWVNDERLRGIRAAYPCPLSIRVAELAVVESFNT